MSRKIELLSDETINQIAAGEVIEHPASVVKELIDNALDAKAQKISIVIQAGGFQSICIEDDGEGMSQEDLSECLKRHATSKIKKVEDLNSLQTLGFRGEALAAIASVCQLEIRSSNGISASKLTAKAGKEILLQPCARNQGTTIEILSLFFNAPARKKFQKSPQASSAAIVRVVQSLALSHPETAFTLVSQGQVLIDVESQPLQNRLEQLLNVHLSEGCWMQEPHVRGFLANPQEAKTTRQGQHFFLNGRPIFSPMLSRALREGYGTRIATTSHPSAVFFLELDPSEFDVNVHPQKREVRFQREGKIYSMITKAIQRAFQPTAHMRDSLATFTFAEPSSFSLQEEPLSPFSPSSSQPVLFSEASYEEKPLAVFGSLLLLQSKEELLLVELSAGSEESCKDLSEKQVLLEPFRISLSAKEALEVEELLFRLEQIGMEARFIGSKDLCIDAISEWIARDQIERFVQCCLADLSQGISAEESRSRILRLSLKAKRWTLQEAEAFWRSHSTMKSVRLTSADLEIIFSNHKK